VTCWTRRAVMGMSWSCPPAGAPGVAAERHRRGAGPADLQAGRPALRPHDGPAGRQHAPGRPYRCPSAEPQGRHAPVLLRPGAAHPARQAPCHAGAAAVRRRDLRPCRAGGRSRDPAAGPGWLACRAGRGAQRGSRRRAHRAGPAGGFCAPVAAQMRVHRALAAKDLPSCASSRRDLPPPCAKACWPSCRCMVTPRCWTRRARSARPARHRHRLVSLQWLAGHLGDTPTTFDLADLRGYAYYSGARFSVFAPAASDALVRGGRYDEVGAVFGRNRPAVGFSLDIKALVQAVGPRACMPRSGRRGASRRICAGRGRAARRGPHRGLCAARP
jgi:hypothetical protein